MHAAREASESWQATPIADRIDLLKAFEQQLIDHRGELSETISRETGKPRWDADAEVGAMIAKIDISIDATRTRCGEVGRELGHSAARGVTRYRPHGVVAVFGPFNFPGHVPNGHIVPALLAGNTVVFKPSEKTPLVAHRTFEFWRAAKLPAGGLGVVQGGRETGERLAWHDGLDGLFFTGGTAAGMAISRIFAGRPGKILALEMGGNNALVVHDVRDLEAAACLSIQSAFTTSGQRCTCARRLVLVEGDEGDRFVDQLVDMMRAIRVGRYNEAPPPFMGPVIDDQAAAHVLAAQQRLLDLGGEPLFECFVTGERKAMLSPGLVDVTKIEDRGDEEIFGPVLQVMRVADFDAAIERVNETSYGLAAGLISDDRELYERFARRVRAGLINWNRPTTGASSWLPFGGVGNSGNHRPAGYFAADYCSYPVASLECDQLAMPADLPPGIAMAAT